MFCGYNRYFLMNTIWRYIRRLPRGVRHAVVSVIQTLPPETWNRVYGLNAKMLPQYLRSVQIGDKAYNLAEILESEDPDAIYIRITLYIGKILRMWS